MPKQAKPPLSFRIRRLYASLRGETWYRQLALIEQQKKEASSPDDQASHEADGGREGGKTPADVVERMEAALLAMPQIHQRIFILWRFDIHPIWEIAEMFRIPEADVVRCMCEALHRLEAAILNREPPQIDYYYYAKPFPLARRAEKANHENQEAAAVEMP